MKIATTLLLTLGFGLLAAPVMADSIDHGHKDPTYQAECGSCHVPYPPRLLSRTEWQQITGKLDQHFGADATLDDAALKKINAFLNANGATQARATPAAGKLPRITETRWFIREHREIGAGVWKKPWVKSASNCAACHGGAEQGGFSEDDVRIPRQ
ncbi:diheme cytochrome c [Fluviicoccus keumensis]|uniref:Diheme cytochrome c n=1 Tax=Fluviicoccus keumensis TaxID=1435465 RepID=A0A4Q7Z8G3_9GAMM|nr:diheme cytochrome c [Fluviicoccus keumensis]RZU46748.1 diheme cytochrome c [Fluviicoccus keumensis]